MSGKTDEPSVGKTRPRAINLDPIARPQIVPQPQGPQPNVVLPAVHDEDASDEAENERPEAPRRLGPFAST